MGNRREQHKRGRKLSSNFDLSPLDDDARLSQQADRRGALAAAPRIG
jgi:hypothetical protein